MRASIVLASALAFAGAALAYQSSQPPAAELHTPHDRLVMIENAAAAAQPGDVLFKSGGGLWGRLAANFSSTDRRYGHVGLVAAGTDGYLMVIHAGGDPASREGRVMREPLTHFLGASERAALYRPALGEDALANLVSFAVREAERQTPFDSAFSLDSTDALYCTELIWRALSAASDGDATPNKSQRSGKVYIALDDLQMSPLLAPVWRHPASEKR